MGSQRETALKKEDFDMSDYSMATYIRQNSVNFERLNSVTESVCLTEEERRLVDQELCKDNYPRCSCSRTEYCSSECKEAGQRPLISVQPCTSHSKSKKDNSNRKLHSCSCPCQCRGKRKTVKETAINMSPISSTDSVDSGDKKSLCCTYLKWAILLFFIIAATIVITVLVCTFLLPQFGVVLTSAGQDTRHTKTVDQPRQAKYLINGTTHQQYVSFALDQDRFRKGGPLRWKKNEAGSSGITLTDNDCLKLSIDAFYELYSKITFEFLPENNFMSQYQNVLLYRDGDVTFLEKDPVDVPRNLRERRLKSSRIMALGKFKADDVICVKVQNSNLVYKSKLDSSLKIIQKM